MVVSSSLNRTGMRSSAVSCTRDQRSAGTGTSSTALHRSATTASKSSGMLSLRDRLAQRGMGTTQMHANRAGVGPQQLADLRRRVVTDVAQRDTRPLLRRQIAQESRGTRRATRSGGVEPSTAPRSVELDRAARRPPAIRKALRHTHASTSSTAAPRRSTCAKASATASLANSASPVNNNNDRHRRACTERNTASTRS